MIKVYVAGAYSDNNVLGVLRNIGRGEEIASHLFQLGFAPFAPWFDKEFVIRNWRYDFSVNSFYEYSIEWMKCADCVLVVPNTPGMIDWQESKGTVKEIEVAKQSNIPVYYTILELCKSYGK